MEAVKYSIDDSFDVVPYCYFYFQIITDFGCMAVCRFFTVVKKDCWLDQLG